MIPLSKTRSFALGMGAALIAVTVTVPDDIARDGAPKGC